MKNENEFFRLIGPTLPLLEIGLAISTLSLIHHVTTEYLLLEQVIQTKLTVDLIHFTFARNTLQES